MKIKNKFLSNALNCAVSYVFSCLGVKLIQDIKELLLIAKIFELLILFGKSLDQNVEGKYCKQKWNGEIFICASGLILTPTHPLKY